MILAEKITNERKKNGWSQEELAEKLSVSRQAVSKWEGAQSIPDLQRIIQLSELFGVSTDYLLKDELEDKMEEKHMSNGENALYVSNGSEGVQPSYIRKVTMEEANTFLEMKRKGAPKVANATALCILSPAILIFLAGLADSGIGSISEAAAAGIGLVFLFGMIAAAVFVFITYGIKESRLEHLEKEVFETEYGVSGMVKEKQRDYEGTFTRGIAIGVVLCIIAVVPLIIVGIMEAPDYICCAFVSFLLILVAVGVNIIIRVSMVKGSFDALLQEGEFTRTEKRSKRKLEAFNGAYWCLATAIYLGWSFWTMRWDITWILWPVAGVLFAAVSAIARFITEK